MTFSNYQFPRSGLKNTVSLSLSKTECGMGSRRKSRRTFQRLAWNIIAGIALFVNSVAAPSMTLRGVVVDGETHSPLEMVRVRIVERNAFAQTNEQGMFLFQNISHGHYTIECSLIGYKEARMEVNAAEGHESETVYIHLFPLPLQSTAVIVTGTHPNSTLDEFTETTSILRGKDLQRDLGTTLASTLKNETGVAIRSMGPAPARPTIRGLSGDRIVISEDGMKTNDLSATSPDHAVTVEPFTIEHIEVVRGPKVLLQTSTTLGGVVNIVRNEIPLVHPEHIGGQAGLFVESANNGLLGSLITEIPAGPLSLRAEFSRRKADDLRTPAGVLGNSHLLTDNVSGSFGYADTLLAGGASWREFSTSYGIPGGFVGTHPNGVRIELFRRQQHAMASWNISSPHLENVEIHFTRTYYHHTEYERSGLIGAEFLSTVSSAQGILHHRSLGPLQNGAVQVIYEYRDFNVGGFVFTSPATLENISAVLSESFTSSEWDIQFAVRGDYTGVHPRRENLSSPIGPLQSRTFTTFSASLSGLLHLDGPWYLGATLSRSSRIPTLEELFSQGPHLAAYSYETGNPTLDTEHGLGGEIFLYHKSPEFFWMVTGFLYDLPNYIITRNSGRTNYQTLLPVYQAAGVSARLLGVESQFEWNITQHLSFTASESFTHGELLSSGTPLPMIPPLKGRMEVKYSSGQFLAGTSVDAASRQSRVDTFEDPTDGYVVQNAFIQYSMETGSAVHTVSLNMDNLYDTVYRNHLSRVKSIMPEAGRNLRVVYRLHF